MRAAIAVPVTAILLPSPAWAQQVMLPQGAVLPAFAFLVALVLLSGGLVWWYRRAARRAAADALHGEAAALRLDDILATAPDGFFRWDFHPDGGVAEGSCSRRLAVLLGLVSGTDADFAEVLEAFDPVRAAVLAVAVEALHRHGTAFQVELALRDGPRRVLATGQRASEADGRPAADVVWMRDVTEGSAAVERLSREGRALTTERDRLRALLDSLSAPIWLRDRDLAPVMCNQAYARAVGAESPDEVVAAGTELVPAGQLREARALAARARAAGQSRSESFHLVMAGKRRRVEITESPVPLDGDGMLMTVGIAIDRTAEEELLSRVERHVAAHAEVLENLGTAIAIFSTDTRLAFFNTAFRSLWRLDADWLGGRPTYGMVLDALREHRRLPEVADFRAYREEELRRFTALLEPFEDLLHLPDERTLRRFISPHPFGGLLMTYEDVTDALALERSLTTSLAVHRATLANLHEGVAVFSSDGRLRLCNPAYGRIWQLAPGDLEGEPHFSELVERHRAFFEPSAGWPAARATMLALLSERAARSGHLERADGSLLDFASVPLPDGAVLTTWLDISDSARVERALRDRNEALAAVDRVKNDLKASVAAEVRGPLNTVLGFADLLGQGRFGSLGDHETAEVRGVREAGRQILEMVGEMAPADPARDGQMALALNAVDIEKLLADLSLASAETIRERSLTLAVDCQPGIGTLMADERHLGRIVAMLVDGAAATVPPGGRLTLAVRRTDGAVSFTLSSTDASGAPIPRDGDAGGNLDQLVRLVGLQGGRVEAKSGDAAITVHVPAVENGAA